MRIERKQQTILFATRSQLETDLVAPNYTYNYYINKHNSQYNNNNNNYHRQLQLQQHQYNTYSLCRNKSPQIIATMFLWPIISGLLFSNAQYSSPLQQLANYQTSLGASGCDTSRLLRCQQDTAKEMQIVSLNAASVQYPIGQGPPYSPAAKLREQQQQRSLASPHTCRLIRSNLDCMLVTTPACYEAGLQAAQNSGDIILRSKRFLEQNNCNDPDTSWQVTFCYRSPEVRNCEERHGFTVYSSTTTSLAAANSTNCLAYQAFKYCLESHLRLNCKVHEIDMANEYLIDRAGDLSWRCPPNSSTTATATSGSLNYGPYALNNPSGSILSPHSSSYGQYSQYEQRPTYVGSTGGLGNLFGTVRDQPWERFKNPYDDARYGISRLPGVGVGGNGEIFDRLVAGGGFDTETSDCPVKAAPYAHECENTLVDQQRLARDSRDGIELQRRVCCSLFQYRDCISRVVLDRCADSTPAAVDILMGGRRREMVISCRGYNRDLCSGALAGASSNSILVLVASLLATIMLFKQHKAQPTF